MALDSQERSRVDPEPNIRNQKSANIKNRSFSGTECKQPSTETKNEPFRSIPRSNSKALCEVFLRLSKSPRSWSFRAAVPHWNAHTACHWHGPALGAFIKCCPVLFLFFDFLSNTVCFFDGMEKHIYKLHSYLSISMSFSLPLLSTCPFLSFLCPFPFPFPYAF